MLAAIIVLIAWIVLHFFVKKSCIFNKLKKSNWQVLPNDYEKLIDNGVVMDGNVVMENDTEL